MDAQEQIKQQVAQNKIVLYMKGTPQFPQCGFSATATEILKRCDGSATVDEIIAQLEAAFNATGLREDVLGMLSHAQEKDWIR